MPRLGIIIASTREGRGGAAVADWFTDIARAHAGFELTTLDLLKWNLPMLAEPNHPRFRNYQHQLTRDWSAAVAAQDAFVVITPEYNYSAPPALVNAVDHLFAEWHYAPVGLVSYGGVSGGVRAGQMIKQLVTAVKMMPMMESVILTFFTRLFDAETGRFDGGDINRSATNAMLDELLRWTDALRTLRRPAAAPSDAGG